MTALSPLQASVDLAQTMPVVPKDRSNSLPFLQDKDCIEAAKIKDLSHLPDYPQIALDKRTAVDFLRAEVATDALDEIHLYLWLAGRPGHVRPLHKQLMLSRTIMITEDPGMHLIWFDNIIFMKPLPVILLIWQFWKDYLCVEEDEKLSPAAFYDSAFGLLHSYTQLIVHHSDYRVAVREHLLPDIGWSQWCALSHDVRTIARRNIQGTTQKRWKYGELRLSRLNWIYKFTFRGYSYFYYFTSYSHYFARNFQILVAAFAYCSIILAAMQVVVSVESSEPWMKKFSFHTALLMIGSAGAILISVVSLLIFLVAYHALATAAVHGHQMVKPKVV